MTKIRLNGQSESTLANYGKCIAKMSLYFGCTPLELTDAQINDYLLLLRDHQQPSYSYFKHTVYGLRYAFRLVGREDRAIRLPAIKRIKDLPVVLSKKECRILFKTPKLLKHRILLSLIYSAGLRIAEVSNLHQRDIDFDRKQIHIRQSKYKKDRYVPLSDLMAKGLQKYYKACQPKDWVFNGKSYGSPFSKRGIGWVLRETLKKTDIQKRVTVHTLRHSSIFKQLFAKNWVVYAKRPFGGPQQVIEYLGRYTHKIAITNHRIEHLSDSTITFRYKEYRKAGKVEKMVLLIIEFIRRFALHILPSGFMRIRHFGFLASRFKKDNLAKARANLNVGEPILNTSNTWQQISIDRLGFDPQICSFCGAKAMVRIDILPPTRAPPTIYQIGRMVTNL